MSLRSVTQLQLQWQIVTGARLQMRGKEESWWKRDQTERDEENRGGYSIFSSTELSPRVQNYLVRVYGNLALTTGAASLAAFLAVQRIASDMGGLGVLASIALFFGIQASRGRIGERLRLGMLLAFGFLQGLDLGPLLRAVLFIEPELVLMAAVGTMLAFVSFTGAALFSPRRSFLYLGGLLTFASLTLLIASFIPFLFNINLYLGLFCFCFYIIYDTQVLVERAEMRRGEGADSVGGALQLFTNLMGIFVRLLVILMNDSKKRNKKKSRRE